MNLSTDDISLLRDLLEEMPPGRRTVGARRYRANQPDKLALLNSLEDRDLLIRDHVHDVYKVPTAALRLVGGDIVAKLLEGMQRVYVALRDEYIAEPGQTITIDTLAKRTKASRDQAAVYVDYLAEAIALGRTADLLSPDATVITSESLIEQPDFQSAMSRWEGVFFPSLRAKAGQPKSAGAVHGNAERFASEREKVLKAALALVARFPEECRDKHGRLSGAGIVRMIEQKSTLWWEDENEMLSHRKMAEIINDSLRVLE